MTQPAVIWSSFTTSQSLDISEHLICCGRKRACYWQTECSILYLYKLRRRFHSPTTKEFKGSTRRSSVNSVAVETKTLSSLSSSNLAWHWCANGGAAACRFHKLRTLILLLLQHDTIVCVTLLLFQWSFMRSQLIEREEKRNREYIGRVF